MASPSSCRLALAALCLLALVHSSLSINCIQCNSANERQEDCSETESVTKYNKVCPKLNEGSFKGSNAIGCRKIIQTISDPDLGTRVIRECAYKGDEVDGQRKTGNWGITIWYYQCTNSKDNEPCNGSSGLLGLTSLLTSAVVLLNRYF